MDNFNLMLEELYKLKNIFIICFAILIFFFTFLYRKVLKKETKVLKNMIKQLYANFVFSPKLKKELNLLFKNPSYKIFGGSDEEQLEYNILDFNFINEKLIFRIEPKNLNSMEFFKDKENHELIKMYISNKYKDYQFSDFTTDRVLYTLTAFKF